jgi:hypothetical protein
MNLNSIVRCLSGGDGLTIIPNHLGKKEIEDEQVKIIWEGNPVLENTLYSQHAEEYVPGRDSVH